MMVEPEIIRQHTVLVFTDLDGCLLNHHDYSFTEAWPALRLLAAHAIPLIINSSKTEAEILAIRQALHNPHPFVVENGAAIFIPQHYFEGFEQPLNRVVLGPTRSELLAILHDLNVQNAFAFTTFNDLGPVKIAELTGLTLAQARQANMRIGSEPLIWLGDDKALGVFKDLLVQRQLRLVKGGRFWHVMGQTDKANAMRWLLQQFQKNQPADYLSIALGDSANDRKMLELADFAIVIKNSRGGHLALTAQKNRVIYSEFPGAKGWNQTLVQLFECTKTEHKHE